MFLYCCFTFSAPFVADPEQFAVLGGRAQQLEPEATRTGAELYEVPAVATVKPSRLLRD